LTSNGTLNSLSIAPRGGAEKGNQIKRTPEKNLGEPKKKGAGFLGEKKKEVRKKKFQERNEVPRHGKGKVFQPRASKAKSMSCSKALEIFTKRGSRAVAKVHRKKKTPIPCLK